ncbi:DUF721 domain-containing protein [Flavobacterium sp.]|uniref:DUF721 domain-containing protein n=1 Tax=Flavobacterium sp. TaxID=239 RepID=UPI003529B9AD
MKRKIGEESPIADVLKEFIQANKLQAGFDKIDVRHAWKNVMGAGVNSYTIDVLLKGNTLYVVLSSSVLREELSLGKTKIIKMLNEEIKRDLISSIVLQ